MQEAVFVDLNMKDKIIIIDDQGVNVTVDSKSFLKHIQKYHNAGISIHEENGHYFTVDDSFRKMLKEKVIEKSDLKDTYEGDGTEWIIERDEDGRVYRRIMGTNNRELLK